jgi:hypothetical protein
VVYETSSPLQLQKRLKQLKARQALAEARQRTLASRQARKVDTRRKIIVGAIVLAKVEQGVMSESQLRGWLDAALHRDDDRGLFDLSIWPFPITCGNCVL